jgi:hypothetical protein
MRKFKIEYGTGPAETLPQRPVERSERLRRDRLSHTPSSRLTDLGVRCSAPVATSALPTEERLIMRKDILAALFGFSGLH